MADRHSMPYFGTPEITPNSVRNEKERVHHLLEVQDHSGAQGGIKALAGYQANHFNEMTPTLPQNTRCVQMKM